MSDIYNPDGDTSFSTETGRMPLRSVNINDDAAERRKRRKSAKFENAQPGPSSEGLSQEQAPVDTPRAMRQKQLASVAPPPPVINVPLDVMSSNFEEWMKMATDNVRVQLSHSEESLVDWTWRLSENQCYQLMEFRAH
jgi:condensin complex subunit 2